MNEAAPGIRRLCIAIATDAPALLPGHRPDGPEARGGLAAFPGDPSPRASLGAVLDEACGAAGVQRVHWVPWPEGGELGVFPPGIDEGRVVAAFTRELCRAVAEANDAQDDVQAGGDRVGSDRVGSDRAGGGTVRLRLRVALHQGITRCDEGGYSGRAVVKACQLLDAEVLRRELAASPGADLVFIVSAELFDDVAGEDHTDLRRSEFRQVTVPGPLAGPDLLAWVSTRRSPARVGGTAAPW
ncbi:hypothetical protein [Parafrankia sp. FMc2]|uniref:hypothetical protein n=1 Tax=Parafrankia sp. FMc2 TaxID=3233196 RepID=UPI0034D4715E